MRRLCGSRCTRRGAPATEAIVLKEESHQHFLESSGLAQEIRSSARREITTNKQALHLRRRYRACPLEKDLCRYICGALLDLDARTVVVRSEERSEGGLGTIPAVLSSVRRAWLSTDGLKRQIEAASWGEEIPTWPVVIQRETEDELNEESSPRA